MPPTTGCARLDFMVGIVTKREHDEFQETRVVVERVHKRVGIQRGPYRVHDWNRDEQALRDSVRRKQELRQREAVQIAAFESWRHGSKLV